jgi:hypothetical protein
VVTADRHLTTDAVSRELNINGEEYAVRVLHSSKSGKMLMRDVRSYMRDRDICSARGDVVIYLDEHTDEGGGSIE